MADGSIKIDTKIDSSGLKSDLKSVTNQIKESFASMRDVMQGPIAAINMIKDALKGMYSATVGNASAIEDMVAAFTPMVDGAENAKKMVAMLNQEAATTPFELEGLGGIAKQVLPLLGNNVDAVRKSIRMLGDTAGGNIQKLDSITRGYMKTMMKGKVDMESLNMIADAGVPIYDQLAKSMGVSVAQMMKMSTEGKITASDLTSAFEAMTSKGGIFYNGMAIASQTLSGKASSMSDALKQAGSVVGNELLSSVESVIDAVANAANGFTAWAKEGNNLRIALQLLGITAVTASMAALVSAVPSIIAGIVALKGAVLAFSAVLMGPMGVVVAIGAVIGALTLLGDARHKAAIKGIEGQFSGLISETGVTAEQIDKIESSLGSMGSVSTDQLATNVRFLSKELGVSADTIARAGMNSKHLTDEFKAQLEQVRLINAEEAKRRGFSSTDDLLAEKAFYREKAKAEAAKNGTTYSEAQLKIISARIKAEDDYARAVASANQKKSAGLITEEERWKLIQDAAGKYLDTLLDLGYAFDDFKSIGGKALNDMAAILRNADLKVGIKIGMAGSESFSDPLSKEISSANSIGGMLTQSFENTSQANAEALTKQFAKDVDDGLHFATSAAKRAAQNIVLAFTNPMRFMQGTAEDALDTLDRIFIKYAGKIITSIGTTGLGKAFRNVFDEIKKSVPGWISDIFNTIRSFWDLGTAGFSLFIAGVFSAMSSLVKFDPKAMLDSMQEILTGVTDFFENDLGALPVYAQSALIMIQSFISGILNNLPALIETAKNVLSFFVKAIIDNGPGIISAAVEIVLGFAKVIIDNLPAIIDAGIKMVIAFIQAIVDNSEMIFTAIANAITGIIQVITDNLPEIIQAACDLFVALVQGLAIALPIILKAIVKALPDIINALVKAIPMIITAIADATPEIIQAIIACFPYIVEACVMVVPLIAIALIQNLPQILYAIGYMAVQIVAGFIQGIVTAGANIWKGICSVFWAVVDAVKSFFGIHSPSTVFSDIGVNIIQGLINGILNAGAGLWDAVKGIFTGLWDAVVEVFKNSFDIGKNFVNGIKDGINSAGGWIKDTAGNVGDAISDAVDDFGDWSGWWASGTENAPPGFAIVGENGPELVQLGGGERIYPAGETSSILSGGRGLASIAAGIGSFAGVGAIPSSAGSGSVMIINKISPAPVQIDGRQVAQVVFENLDKCVGAAYGH